MLFNSVIILLHGEILSEFDFLEILIQLLFIAGGHFFKDLLFDHGQMFDILLDLKNPVPLSIFATDHLSKFVDVHDDGNHT